MSWIGCKHACRTKRSSAKHGGLGSDQGGPACGATEIEKMQNSAVQTGKNRQICNYLN